MNTIKAREAALITGASTGIGAIYADRLAKRGHDLILCRPQRGPARIAGAPDRERDRRKVETVKADLTSPADLRRVEHILRSHANISVLANNAGVGAADPLVASDIDKLEDRLNVTALTRLTYAAAPVFVGRGSGTIIDIASVVAIAPEVLNGVYGGNTNSPTGRPRAGGSAGRHRNGALGYRRQAGSPTSSADGDVGG